MDELRALVGGRYGTPPVPIDEGVRRAIDLVSGDLPEEEPAANLAELRDEAEGLASSEEELLLLALFGEDAEPLLRTIRGRASGEETLATGGVDRAQAERIRELVRVVQESGVAEVTVEEDGMRVSVRRSEETPALAAAAPDHAGASSRRRPFPPPEQDGLVRVEAPMVGMFYRAPEPGAAPFVAGGRTVQSGPDPVHPRGDEADERDQVRRGRDRARHPRSQRGARRVRAAAVRAGARPRAAGRRALGMFSRVLIANRGEVAVRVIRTLHDLGIEAVAIYSTADADALHVRMADRAVCVGPPAAAQSYLNIPSVVAAGETTRCDAVHPGWGFLAENAAFVRACADNDLVFIGPSPETMEQMGDKVEAKAAMAEAGMPLIPGTEHAVDVDGARAAADELGYPVLLKASAGGGGRGMRLVESPEQLEDVFQGASAEANAAFGDGSLYVEKALVPARHVEVQVLADGQGGVLTLGERECSIQRRHQKLIEESPSPAVSPALREEIEGAVERACLQLGYRNAGTFEFLLGPDGGFYFMELNARLQVEHPVTELVTGIDLVREQLEVAAGKRLERTGRIERRGHAIEARINAEDVARDFAPAPGRIEHFRAPLGPGVRMDTHVESGTVVSPYYDSLVGKVVVWDEDRPSAIARAVRALTELEVTGIPTTRELAIGILRGEAFGSGRYSTSFLDEMAPVAA